MIKNRTKSHYKFVSAVGRTMMETLMVLALYGLLTLSLYKLVSNVFTAHEESAAVVEITKIVDGLHSLYKWTNLQSSTSSLTPTQYAMQEGILESSPNCARSHYDSSYNYKGTECAGKTPIPPIGERINITSEYVDISNSSTISCAKTNIQTCQNLTLPTEVTKPSITGVPYETLCDPNYSDYTTYQTQCEAYKQYLSDLTTYQTNVSACSTVLASCRHIFSIALEDITEGQCRKLASADWGTSFYSITTNVNGSTTLYSTDANYPFREVDVIALCKGAVKVTLTFF